LTDSIDLKGGHILIVAVSIIFFKKTLQIIRKFCCLAMAISKNKINFAVGNNPLYLLTY